MINYTPTLLFAQAELKKVSDLAMEKKFSAAWHHVHVAQQKLTILASELLQAQEEQNRLNT